MVGIRGSKRRARDEYEAVKTFLSDNLKLELNEKKTLITDVKKHRANFLGAEIRSHVSKTFDAKQTKRSYKGQLRKVRVPSGQVILLAPIEKLVQKLVEQGICRIVNFNRRLIIPHRKTA